MGVKELAKGIWYADPTKTRLMTKYFAEKMQDAIHEYLLLKGIEFVSNQCGKDQQEHFRSVWEKDVLVAIKVALKGLDFPDVSEVGIQSLGTKHFLLWLHSHNQPGIGCINSKIFSADGI